LLRKLKQTTDFTRNFLTLLTGTTIAQAIPIVISPLLTRTYTPVDFGTFALYMSVVSIISILATGRYEMAIMLPDDNEEVNAIVKLVSIIMVATSAITLLIVFFFNQEITSLLGNPEISNWLYFLPVSILLLSSYQVFNYLLIREKNFSMLAKNKVVLATTGGLTKLGGGFFWGNSFGLLLGNTLGYIASIYLIVRNKILWSYFKNTSISVKTIARKYKKFPQYDVPAIAVNVFANQLPLLVLGKYFSLEILGFYSLTYKVLILPVSLLSNAILDVFKQQATEDYNKYGNCSKIYVKTLSKLIWMGTPIFVILGLLAPNLFEFIYGEEWKIAGEFAQIIAPMIFLKFIISPLSYTFYIAQKQHINFYGQILLLLFMLLALYFGIQSNDIQKTLTYLTISSSAVYVIYLCYSFMLSKGYSE